MPGEWDNSKLPRPRRLEPFWTMMRRTWHVWSVALCFLVGLGIIQIEGIKLAIPQHYSGYILIGSVLVWALIALMLSSVRNYKLERELERVQPLPSFLIEDVALSSMHAHIAFLERCSKPNPVVLDLYKIDCRIVGRRERKDADVRYYFRGKNIGQRPLTGLCLPIAGDSAVPFTQLHARVFNLHADPTRLSPLRPRLEGSDGIRKDLFLPFLSPGVEPHDSFEIELTYKWPGIFGATKGYWFLDNINFEGPTRHITIVWEFTDMLPDSVRAYAIPMASRKPTFLGAVPPDPSNSTLFAFEKVEPEKDTYYVLVFEGKPRVTHKRRGAKDPSP
ncbi:MAG TPA: hypothetical protein VM537_02300 [Anaerolineae bacterium]|nr:hypothetical protein [Anaerolineae bacterium]